MVLTSLTQMLSPSDKKSTRAMPRSPCNPAIVVALERIADPILGR